MNKYQNLRNEVRAYCPDAVVLERCKEKEQLDAFARIKEKMDDYYRKYPDSNAVEMRRKYYQIASDEIIPKLFLNSPFYFSLGINGGWLDQPGTWFHENFQSEVLEKNVPQEDLKHFLNRRNEHFMLCCGAYVDSIHHLLPLTKMLKKGISGIYAEVQEALQNGMSEEERLFLETAADGLLAVQKIQLKFHKKALEKLQDPNLTADQKKFMQMAADASKRVPWEAPRTFFEGLNLFFFARECFGLLDSLKVYSLGNPDSMLYDFYQADLAAGRITKDEAYDLLCRFMVISDAHYDGMRTVSLYGDHELEQPVTIGGCDKDGIPVFNELTRMIIEGHRENDLVFPKLHCRIGKNSPKEYFDELAKDVGNSRCVHTLFNDDVIIPGLISRGRTPEEARRYSCCGCWDGFVDGVENADVANYYSLARVLEAMIYQDPGLNEKIGYVFEPLDDAASPVEFRDRVCRAIRECLRCMLKDLTEYGKLYSQISPHPAYSVGLDGCIKNRKDDTAGGADVNTRVVTLAFLPNVIDSILAVKRICFDLKLCSVKEFLDVVRNNWEGREDLRQEAMRASYWGDDKTESKELGKYILDVLFDSVKDLKNERGGTYEFSIWIYREFRYWGEQMRALPDGRRNGDPLAQALNPSDFRNHEEITTTMNALTCLDYSKLISSNLNLTFSKEKITPPILSALFNTFIEKELHLLQPNCFSKEELEDAMIHPEDHKNLIVKVCGFSARFVALEPQWQKIILNRYQY